MLHIGIDVHQKPSVFSVFDPAAMKRWRERDCPAIARRAKAEKAEIHWGDQMGLRSDHQSGASSGRRGKTPVIPGTGQRFGCNMMSSVTNRGHLSFLMFSERFTAALFIRFCRRPLRQRRRKVFLILERHPVHRSQAVWKWLDANAHGMRVFFLPACSPELNPDEYLNNDVKSNAVGRRRAADKRGLMANVEAYLRGTQRRPNIVKNCFQAEHVRYAAG